MKLPLLLAGSLALNAAIAVALVVRDRPSADASPAAPDAPAAPRAAAATAPTTPRTWAELGLDEIADDVSIAPADADAAFVSTLRAQGFPVAAIRAIVGARVRERFAARRKAIENENPRTFWRADSGYSAESANHRIALRDLQREQSDHLKALLGSEAEPEFMRAMQRRRYGDLPPEKIRDLEALVRDYSDLTSQVRNESMGMMLAEDREKIAYLEKEQQADLAKLLTPDELAAYELRASPTAGQLKSRLAFFDASESEYLALFGLQKTFDAAHGRLGEQLPQSAQQRADAQKKLATDIEAALGAERYATYKIATDSTYRQVNQLVARLSLPATATAQVIAVQQDTQKRAADLRNNRALTNAQRNTQLAELAQEATGKLTASLGAEGIAAYKQGYPGNWLNNLAPRPQPTPPPKP